MHQAFQIAPRLMYRENPPERNLPYLAFIRRFPCVVCGKTRWVEAAHFGPHGIGQKASDMDALPLCGWCHRVGPQSYHHLSERDFIVVHNLDVPSLIQMFRSFWEQKQERNAL